MASVSNNENITISIPSFNLGPNAVSSPPATQDALSDDEQMVRLHTSVFI